MDGEAADIIQKWPLLSKAMPVDLTDTVEGARGAAASEEGEGLRDFHAEGESSGAERQSF